MSLPGPLQKLRRIHYSIINSLTPFRQSRWVITFLIAIFFVYLTQHFFTNLVTYLVGLYLILLVLKYFIPKGIPDDFDQLEEEDHGFYHSHQQIHLNSTFESSQFQHSEDKPLARSLSQIQIWYRSTLALTLGLIVSYFSMLQIDVFWPLLLIYFGGLALYTVLKILKTMKKYNYGLADFVKHQPREEEGLY